LGWDGDAWRGEGASEFGPASDPSSASADGMPTGIRIHSISKVSSDTTRVDGICQQILFRPALEFRVEFAPPASATIQPKATLRLVDVAPVGEPKLTDLSYPGRLRDGALEIVQAGASGVVYAFGGDLSQWLDGDQDPQTTGVLARATSTTPPRFRGAPALGDLDADGHDELILLGDDAFYIFRADGTEFVDGDLDPSTHGPAFVFAQTGIGIGAPVSHGGRLFALRHLDAATAQLVAFDPLGQTAATVERPATELGDGLALTDLTGSTGIAFAFLAGGSGGLVIYSAADLSAVPTQLPATPARGLGIAAWARADGTALFWQDRSLALFEQLADASQPARRAPQLPAPLSSPVVAPIGPQSDSGVVHVFAAGRTLQALDANLRPRSGFPYRADFRGERTLGPAVQAAPILADLDGDDRVEIVWSDPVGRIHAVDLNGRPLAGFPVLGPAEPLGSLAIGQLDDDAQFELVVCGRFGELIDVDAPSRQANTREVGTLATYDLSADASNFAPWPQGRVDGANRAHQALLGASPSAGSGGTFQAGSLLVHPHPATGSSLRIRVQLRRAASVRATLYNLEGEVVAEGPLRDAVGGGAYDEAIDISGLVSGFYLCRVHGGSESLRIPFTVVR
jgi:hypothetical protein